MPALTPSEGVIKFTLDFQTGPAPQPEWLPELTAWRELFKRLGLLGQDPGRYAGFGFGNLSRRVPGATDNRFIISGTQTGGLDKLDCCHYAQILASDLQNNRIVATGKIPPSSEALSHAVLYQACAHIDWVMHLHSPEIFSRAAYLGLQGTDPTAAYGTVQMAEDIRRLAGNSQTESPGLIVMTGHLDGILAYGRRAQQVGGLVVATLADALSPEATP